MLPFPRVHSSLDGTFRPRGVVPVAGRNVSSTKRGCWGIECQTLHQGWWATEAGLRVAPGGKCAWPGLRMVALRSRALGSGFVLRASVGTVQRLRASAGAEGLQCDEQPAVGKGGEGGEHVLGHGGASRGARIRCGAGAGARRSGTHAGARAGLGDARLDWRHVPRVRLQAGSGAQRGEGGRLGPLLAAGANGVGTGRAARLPLDAVGGVVRGAGRLAALRRRLQLLAAALASPAGGRRAGGRKCRLHPPLLRGVAGARHGRGGVEPAPGGARVGTALGLPAAVGEGGALGPAAERGAPRPALRGRLEGARPRSRESFRRRPPASARHSHLPRRAAALRRERGCRR